MKNPYTKGDFTPEWLIVGLGNPGATHKYNRHNAGFLCIDTLASNYAIEINQVAEHAFVGMGEIGGKQCVLMKPNTYMNASGVAVNECACFYQIPPERILIIFDDISFVPGVLRIRRQGSSGGHNGIKSIIEHISSQTFPRIKLGVGQKPEEGYDLAKWVVSDMNDQELDALQVACEKACEAIALIVCDELEVAMARYNH